MLRASVAGSGPCHDLSHAVRVALLAERIAAEEGSDRRLAALAGLVHDVGHAFSGPADDHNIRSADWLRQRLPGRVSADDLAILVEATSRRRFRYLTEPAPSATAAILDDADNLDALGAHGVARAFLWLGEHGRPGVPTDLAEVAEGDVGALRRHWAEKLERLPALMRTRPGRRLAAQRAARLRDFLDRLDLEVADGGPHRIAEPPWFPATRTDAGVPGLPVDEGR
jgi:uncharacterized protein